MSTSSASWPQAGKTLKAALVPESRRPLVSKLDAAARDAGESAAAAGSASTKASSRSSVAMAVASAWMAVPAGEGLKL